MAPHEHVASCEDDNFSAWHFNPPAPRSLGYLATTVAHRIRTARFLEIDLKPSRNQSWDSTSRRDRGEFNETVPEIRKKQRDEQIIRPTRIRRNILDTLSARLLCLCRLVGGISRSSGIGPFLFALGRSSRRRCSGAILLFVTRRRLRRWRRMSSGRSGRRRAGRRRRWCLVAADRRQAEDE
jgi:hypothetical protein